MPIELLVYYIEMMMQSLEGYFSIISELLELEPDQL